MRLALRTRAISPNYYNNGLEKNLDLCCVEHGEYFIFCRKGSLLCAKIERSLKLRTAAETVEALIHTTLKGYCTVCYMKCRLCHCPKDERNWLISLADAEAQGLV